MTDEEDFLAKQKDKYSKEDYDLIAKALDLASHAHAHQVRATGEPYIIHPISVAKTLSHMNMDAASIAAALLHDTVEDTNVKYDDIKAEFGKEIADLVDGVTKLSRIKFVSKEEQKAESLRKMFLATSNDPRVVVLKLADRLHNMRTLGAKPGDRQIEIANETLSIYAPLANRLGIYKIKWELEDLSLRYLDPDAYRYIQDNINQKRDEREKYISEVVDMVNRRLEEMNITAEVYGRPKHFYSIYKKMNEHHVGIDQIYDLTAVRIIVESVKDCYGSLGIVHTIFKPMPGRFKDYIAMPKTNLYQSLHTTVIGPNGTPFEIQIRTRQMHETAEYGIAAHWKYKEHKTGVKADFDQKLNWLRRMLEYDSDNRNPHDFMDNVKTDLFSDEVFVFTPKGDVIDLPAGATPLDFAYSIHSAIGNRCIGAKVNGRIVNLDATLKTGDIVDILTTSQPHGPSRDWLNIVKTSEARNKIRQWFKKELREENILKGKDMLEKEAKHQGFSLSSLMQAEWLEPLMSKYMLANTDDLYASIGYGGLSLNQILAKLIEEYRRVNNIQKPDVQKSKSKSSKKSGNDVVVVGQDDMLVRFAHCCNPLPGDPIVGYITRGRGVSIHRADCNNICGFEKEREVEVAWATQGQSQYNSRILVIANDRRGVVMDISNLIYSREIELEAFNAQSKNEICYISIDVSVKNIDQLDALIKVLRQVNGVIEVHRVNQ